jgi:hypothetical protein
MQGVRKRAVPVDAQSGAIGALSTLGGVGRPFHCHPMTARSHCSSTATSAERGVGTQERQIAWPLWEDNGLVFVTQQGRPLGASHVQRAFKRPAR